MKSGWFDAVDGRKPSLAETVVKKTSCLTPVSSGFHLLNRNWSEQATEKTQHKQG
jgi:hypothetical protein